MACAIATMSSAPLPLHSNLQDSQLTDAGVALLAARLGRLTSLRMRHLKWCERVTPAGLTCLSRLTVRARTHT